MTVEEKEDTWGSTLGIEDEFGTAIALLAERQLGCLA